jgi:integration host factor subunit beta
MSILEEESKKNTVTKKKLIHAISQEKGIHPNDVRHVVQAFLDKLTDFLSNGGRVEFRDFGVFDVVVRQQKIGRNPKKPEDPVIIPSKPGVKFTAGKKMRALIEKSKTNMEKVKG